MAEKQSYNLQIKVSQDTKEKLEKLAEDAGVTLNEYIKYMFIKEIKEN